MDQRGFSDGSIGGAGAALLLLEDRALVRESLTKMIHSETIHRVIGATGDLGEALEMVESLQPTLVLMSYRHCEDTDGVEVLGTIRSACPETRVLILSLHMQSDVNKRDIFPALNGVAGVVASSEGSRALFEAIDHVLALSSGTNGEGVELAREAPRSSAISSLSAREKLVFRLVASGHTVREMAKDLGISRKTIETHRCNIRAKLNLDTCDELRRFAREHFGKMRGQLGT